MSIATPIVNARQYYINGLRLAYGTGTLISVTPGKCSNSTNANDISVGLPMNVASTQRGTEPAPAGSGAVIINTATNGAGGLDFGSMANNTFYAVYAIGNSSNAAPGSALISANLASPLLPSDYDMFFRIGYVKTDGSANILAFRQDGSDLDRWMWYDEAIVTNITNGSSATFAAVDCSGGLPTNLATSVNFLCSFSPTAAGNSLNLRPGASSSTTGYAITSGTVAAVLQTVNMVCATDSPNTDAIDYKVTGSGVIILVQAYVDQLGLVVVA